MNMFEWGQQHEDDQQWWQMMDEERQRQEMEADAEYDALFEE